MRIGESLPPPVIIVPSKSTQVKRMSFKEFMDELDQNKHWHFYHNVIFAYREMVQIEEAIQDMYRGTLSIGNKILQLGDDNCMIRLMLSCFDEAHVDDDAKGEEEEDAADRAVLFPPAQPTQSANVADISVEIPDSAEEVVVETKE